MLNEATATFIGKITKTESGEGDRPYLRMTLPVTVTYPNDKNEKVEKTYWHEVTAFGKYAETLQKLKVEGRYVRVKASITTSVSDIAGKKVSQTNFIAQDLQFLDKKPS